MKQTRLIMGMSIRVEILDDNAREADITEVFDHFQAVDERFSTYKSGSEISRINRGLPVGKWSRLMKQVMTLCEQTRQQTAGFFDIRHNGKLDPSGVVKGWSIQSAADLLRSKGYRNFYIDAGGDIQTSGQGRKGAWQIGLRNPFNPRQVVKKLKLSGQAVATSGTYIRGQHIYNPHQPEAELSQVVSLTVVGPNIYDADRFATAAFAMGKQGIGFIQRLEGLEAYMIDKTGLATMTSGFERYVAKHA